MRTSIRDIKLQLLLFKNEVKEQLSAQQAQLSSQDAWLSSLEVRLSSQQAVVSVGSADITSSAVAGATFITASTVDITAEAVVGHSGNTGDPSLTNFIWYRLDSNLDYGAHDELSARFSSSYSFIVNTDSTANPTAETATAAIDRTTHSTKLRHRVFDLRTCAVVKLN
ncbi:hypothetical protein BGX33_008395 [Mortierella sp. NVP41]|nr:hypothetical protein BGX33_008395 [Mortierella sp. NVP41]